MPSLTTAYPFNEVLPEETLVRHILKPKHWDEESQSLKPGFIYLRGGENGVSFTRHDFLGGTGATIENGQNYASIVTNAKLSKHPTQTPETFIGWGCCNAEQLLSLDNSIILKIDNPNQSPEHVNVCFQPEDKIIKGIVKDPKILYLFECIEQLLSYQYFETK